MIRVICETILASDISHLHDPNRIIHLTGPRIWTRVIKDYLYSQGYDLNQTMPWPDGNKLTKHGDVLIHSIMGFNRWSPDAGDDIQNQMAVHFFTGHREGGWTTLTGIPRILYTFDSSEFSSNVLSWTTKNPTFRLETLYNHHGDILPTVHDKYNDFNNGDILYVYSSFSDLHDRFEFLKYMTLYNEGGLFFHPTTKCNTGFDQWMKGLKNDITMSLRGVVFLSVYYLDAYARCF